MYDILMSIIGHTWVNNYSGEQQYIYNGCIALILVLTVSFVDVVKAFYAQLMRK